MTALFITGTGTDVGKTVVTAGLAALLQRQGGAVCVYKPIQTGAGQGGHPDDLAQVKRWAGEDIVTANTYHFSDPAAPYAADPQRTIKPRHILHEFQQLKKAHRHVLVEGAGGVRVPVAKGFEMIDLIRMLQIPVLVVAGPQLGTINHILLTLEALERQRLEVKGVVISGMPENTDNPAVKTLLETLEAFSPAPILGTLPVFELHPGCFQQESALASFAALNLFQDEEL